MSKLQAPFVYFGGKSKIASQVWQLLGDPYNYVEPFAGSMAVLLGRPRNGNGHQAIETVNDLDANIANFWRALAAEPETVGHYANDPVNEADLIARHIWLVNTGEERFLKVQGDPDYYDAKAAGWWCWGINCWIGSGWCAGNGSWNCDEDGRLVNIGEDEKKGYQNHAHFLIATA